MIPCLNDLIAEMTDRVTVSSGYSPTVTEGWSEAD